MIKKEAEVDEFHVLCVTMRGRGWWVEAAYHYVGTPVGHLAIDAENASPGNIREVLGILHGLREWCTEGGSAAWLKKSSPTTF